MIKLFLAAALAPTFAHASVIAIADEIKPVAVSSTPSFSDAQASGRLIDGSGLADGRHDNNGQGNTMWHTGVNPAPSAPAAGLPAAHAWVRFDFKEPRKIDALRVWNHNQAGLTDRGFKKTRVYGTEDGTTWFKLTETDSVELPRGGDTPTTIALRPGKAVKGVILAAESNYGGNCYGLSEVKFDTIARVDENAAPFPAALECRVEAVYGHRKDGGAGREITVKFSGAKLYGDTEAEIAVEGGATEKVRLSPDRTGLAGTTLLLPAGVGVEKAAQVAITLRRGAKTVSAKMAVPAKRQWTVFIYPHSHVDIGYTQTQAIVEKITVRNLRVGMEIARDARKAGEHYVWNPEVAWAAESFLRDASPDEKRDFVRAVKDGDVGLDASFANLDTSVCSDEELIHYFRPGMKLRQFTGAPLDTMTQVDVPGMSWGLVTAAAQCGVRGVLDLPNGWGRVGTIHTHFQRPFKWVSPDGKSSILYLQGPQYDLGWMWKGQYTRPNPYPHFPDPAPGWTQDWPSVVDRLKTATPSRYFIPIEWLLHQTAMLEKEGLPYDYFTLTWSMSDNAIVDADVPEAVKAWNQKYAYPKLVVASAHEIIDAYLKKFGDKIPEKRGDLTEYWTDGLGTDARRTGYNRVSKENLIQAEVLRSMIAPKTGDDAFNAISADAWRNILLGSEHTWGFHNPARPIAKEIEKVKAGFFEKGRELSSKILGDTLALAGKTDGDSLTVFNTLSFDRDGVVALPAGVNGLTDASGTAVPVQKLASGETVFLARDVPALGSKTWKIIPSVPSVSSAFVVTATTLENDLVKVELDPKTGDVAHLTDKRTGHDFTDSKSPYAINSYRYLKGGQAASKALNVSDVRIARGDDGAVCASLVVTSKAPGCNGLVREVRLTAGSPKVEFIDTVDKISTREKEGVHFAFAFNVPGGDIRMDIPWGRMNPLKDQLPGSNKNWLAFQRFVDVSNAERGVTWCAIEAPIIELGDITANILGMAANTNHWRKEIKPTQTVVSWALNNHWFTNFPLEQGGVIPFRYAVLPHGAFDPVEANHFGLAQNRPLLAVRTDGAPKMVAPVTLDNPRVLVSTAKPADDGSGATILRLKSVSDKPERVTLAFPGGAPKSLRHCLGDEIAKDRTDATQELPPFGCLSLRIER